MKTTWKKLLALALALTMAFALCACGAQPVAPAADANTGSNEAPAETAGRTETITFRVGWPTSGQEGDVIMPGIMAVTDYVTEKSGGTIQFEYFPNQQLGTENDMTDSLITGDLDIGVISNTVAATYWPELYLYALPFAFDSFDEFWALCGQDGWNDGAVTKAIRESIESKGQVHVFNAVCNTFRGMQSNVRPITKPSDFEGITLRVQAGEMYADIYNAIGASTASIPFGELYTSLQQGVCQAEDVGIATDATMRMYEVTKYAVELNHCMTANMFLMSNKAYDQLTEEERGWFMEGCKLAEKVAYDTVVSGDAAAYELYAKEGVEVIRHDELDPEALAEFKSVTSSVWDKYRALIGEELFGVFEEGLAAIKK